MTDADFQAAGREFPPRLTGGESPRSAEDVAIDWFSATFLPESYDLDVGAEVWELLKRVIGSVSGVTAPPTKGYAQGCKFYVRSFGQQVNIGRCDWGGDLHLGRARLELFGSGSSVVKHWWGVLDWLDDQDEVKITRVDLALDFLEGEFGIKDGVQWLKEGLFNNGGRNPRHSTPGDWLSEQPTHGRTLEIGRRENGKMLRVYEKGRQLGRQDSKWVRFEVEIRNNDREIPLDVLRNPGKYFAGAYKALEGLSDHAPCKIATQQKEGEITVERMSEVVRTQYGPFFHVLRASLSAEQVLDALSRPGVPRRLERSAVVKSLEALEF